LSIYNEIFLNGEHDIGLNKRVDTYDRNRFYGAVGYSISDNLKLQIGYMHQDAKAYQKGQLQFGIMQTF
jgi:hypothetical protein